MVKQKKSVLFKRDDRLFKALIENSWDVVLLIDAKARILYSSPSVVRQFGREYHEFIGTNGIKFIHPADSPKVLRLLGQLLLHPGSPIHLEMRIRHKKRHYVWVEAIATNFLRDKDIKGIVVNFHDISSLKRIEERKDEFISIASHELKSPLSSLKVYLQLLSFEKEEVVAQKIHEFMSKMSRQVDRLERLVDDLYEAARIREGKLVLQKERFKLVNLVKESIEEIKHNNNSHDITLSVRYEGSVIADKFRIQQVIVNLLTNAIKFSPDADKIRVTVREKDEDIFTSVTDYGIGIAEKDVAKITRRFFQAEANEQRTSGLGLGLYISYNIVKQHGGKLQIKSIPGKSTTITFSLPKNGK